MPALTQTLLAQINHKIAMRDNAGVDVGALLNNYLSQGAEFRHSGNLQRFTFTPLAIPVSAPGQEELLALHQRHGWDPFHKLQKLPLPPAVYDFGNYKLSSAEQVQLLMADKVREAFPAAGEKLNDEGYRQLRPLQWAYSFIATFCYHAQLVNAEKAGQALTPEETALRDGMANALSFLAYAHLPESDYPALAEFAKLDFYNSVQGKPVLKIAALADKFIDPRLGRMLLLTEAGKAFRNEEATAKLGKGQRNILRRVINGNKVMDHDAANAQKLWQNIFFSQFLNVPENHHTGPLQIDYTFRKYNENAYKGLVQALGAFSQQQNPQHPFLYLAERLEATQQALALLKDVGPYMDIIYSRTVNPKSGTNHAHWMDKQIRRLRAGRHILGRAARELDNQLSGFDPTKKEGDEENKKNKERRQIGNRIPGAADQALGYRKGDLFTARLFKVSAEAGKAAIIEQKAKRKRRIPSPLIRRLEKTLLR
ncbi:MAG: hypothetical protein AB7U41_03675 [Dongiaceae bacterium]